MEEELTCPCCRNIYNSPVLLPCFHSICFQCAHKLVKKKSGSNGTCSTTEGDECIDSDIDKFSETDSGVSLGLNGSGQSIFTSFSPTSIPQSSKVITCPHCHRTMYMEEGLISLPRNKVMESVISRYHDSRRGCQMCEGRPVEATVFCEQCEVFYCERCRENFHPSRGPLAKHVVVSAAPNHRISPVRKSLNKSTMCHEHVTETVSMYCMNCHLSICSLCVQEGSVHRSHDARPLTQVNKQQKNDLSHALSELSGKAKMAKDQVINLKSKQENVASNYESMKLGLISQCDMLIKALTRRKKQLVEFGSRERDYKTQILKDHSSACTFKLKQTAGLIEYCIEAMKESDPASFLQVSSHLIDRVQSIDHVWEDDLLVDPPISIDFDFQIDTQSGLEMVERLNFVEVKLPGQPMLLRDQSTANNSSITVAWQPHLQSYIDGYILELDDGCSGNFEKVYTGKETMCTVDGLEFNKKYCARVKAFNHAGDGVYSQPLLLETTDTASFRFDVDNAHPEIIFSNENLTITSSGFEERVVLGNIGFSRGVHYWEFTLDRYDSNPDPAFGIARFNVPKDAMLGKDGRACSMYIDSARSWFMTDNIHSSRTECGIDKGSVVGVLLDMDKGVMRYYVNDIEHGPVAFRTLKGVYFPAISLNRNVQVTLHSGLDIPE